MASKTARENPLSSFSRLSSSVYLKEPTTTSGPESGLPTTIVLSFWLNAPPRALVKYITEYARLAPGSRIVFILSSTRDFFLRDTAQHRRLIPAVEAIRASTTPGSPVFLHAFSNGGAFTTAHLLMAYREATGSAMSVSSMVVDSAPGKATISSGAKAMSYTLPKTPIIHSLALGVIYTVLIVQWLIQKVFRVKDTVSFSREAINDPDLISPVDGTNDGTAKRRCYIYSDTDELIKSEDVESHAVETEGKGWIVEREKFEGSPHVGHMRADPERYWAIVDKYLRETGRIEGRLQNR